MNNRTAMEMWMLSQQSNIWPSPPMATPQRYLGPTLPYISSNISSRESMSRQGVLPNILCTPRPYETQGYGHYGLTQVDSRLEYTQPQYGFFPQQPHVPVQPVHRTSYAQSPQSFTQQAPQLDGSLGDVTDFMLTVEEIQQFAPQPQAPHETIDLTGADDALPSTSIVQPKEASAQRPKRKWSEMPWLKAGSQDGAKERAELKRRVWDWREVHLKMKVAREKDESNVSARAIDDVGAQLAKAEKDLEEYEKGMKANLSAGEKWEDIQEIQERADQKLREQKYGIVCSNNEEHRRKRIKGIADDNESQNEQETGTPAEPVPELNFEVNVSRKPSEQPQDHQYRDSDMIADLPEALLGQPSENHLVNESQSFFPLGIATPPSEELKDDVYYDPKLAAELLAFLREQPSENHQENESQSFLPLQFPTPPDSAPNSAPYSPAVTVRQGCHSTEPEKGEAETIDDLDSLFEGDDTEPEIGEAEAVDDFNDLFGTTVYGEGREETWTVCFD